MLKFENQNHGNDGKQQIIHLETWIHLRGNRWQYAKKEPECIFSELLSDPINNSDRDVVKKTDTCARTCKS